MKRTIAVLLSVLLLFAAVPFAAAETGSAVTLSIEGGYTDEMLYSPEGTDAQFLKVDVALDGLSEDVFVASFQAEIRYDAEKVHLMATSFDLEGETGTYSEVPDPFGGAPRKEFSTWVVNHSNEEGWVRLATAGADPMRPCSPLFSMYFEMNDSWEEGAELTLAVTEDGSLPFHIRFTDADCTDYADGDVPFATSVESILKRSASQETNTPTAGPADEPTPSPAVPPSDTPTESPDANENVIRFIERRLKDGSETNSQESEWSEARIRSLQEDGMSSVLLPVLVDETLQYARCEAIRARSLIVPEPYPESCIDSGFMENVTVSFRNGTEERTFTWNEFDSDEPYHITLKRSATEDTAEKAAEAELTDGPWAYTLVSSETDESGLPAVSFPFDTFVLSYTDVYTDGLEESLQKLTDILETVPEADTEAHYDDLEELRSAVDSENSLQTELFAADFAARLLIALIEVELGDPETDGIDHTELLEAIEYAEDVIRNESGDFSNRLKQLWENAWKDAKDLLEDPDATQSDVDRAVKNIYELSKTGESITPYVLCAAAFVLTLIAAGGIAVVSMVKKKKKDEMTTPTA